LQQSLELLSRAQGCGKCWPCRYEHRVAAIAGIAVLQRCGRSWSLPFLTVAAEAGFCCYQRLRQKLDSAVDYGL